MDRKRNNKSKQQYSTNTLKIDENQLKDLMEGLESYYKNYPNSSCNTKIRKTKDDLQNKEYKIAVVANMTAGKSTFINALFGNEVLPAYKHATTDSATFIYSKPDIEKKAIIHFSNKKEPIEIKENLVFELNQYAQKDEECEDKKYKNVEHIELYYPFKYLQTTQNEDIAITFVDTPGPNSTGDTYKEKHKDQTRQVLNDVDLALFMFDFEQIDANLESDEQGLWHTIKTRYDKDKNFEVYFLLNKIDEAFSDNFKDITTKDKDEYIKQKIENWYKHEAKAIAKLKEAAKKHGIDEAKIYSVSSLYQLLHRKDKNWDEEDKLENFQKKHFKRLFEEMWESKFIEYLGIERMENDINTYIKSNVKDKILKKAYTSLIEIYKNEKDNLEIAKQTLEKPKAEAEINLKNAQDFLENSSTTMQKNMEEELKILEEKTFEKIVETVEKNINEKLIKNINKMSKKTIAFTQSYALDGKYNLAKKKSEENGKKVDLSSAQVSMKVNKSVDKQDVTKQMQHFMKTLIEDYKRDYLDIKTDIRELYFKFGLEVEDIVFKYKENLDKELGKKLDVSFKGFDVEKINVSSTLNVNIDVPDSVLEYHFKTNSCTGKRTRKVSRAKYSPLRLFSDTYTESYTEVFKTKTHEFIISPKNLKNSIEKSIQQSCNELQKNDVKNHKDTISKYISTQKYIFQNYRFEKQKEVNKLQKDIQDVEKNLKKVNEKYSKFNKINIKEK